jgi:hypothetical protein
MPRDNVGMGSFKDNLDRAWGRRDYASVRSMLINKGYRVPPKGSSAGKLLTYAYNFARVGGTVDEFRRRSPSYDPYFATQYGSNQDPNDRSQVGSDRTNGGKKKKKGNGSKSTGTKTDGTSGTGDSAVGIPNVKVPGQVDYRQFLATRLMNPAKYARSMTDLEFGGALRDVSRMVKDEKRRETNLPGWVAKNYDPLIQGLQKDSASQSAFGAATAANYQNAAATAADLFGNDQQAASLATGATAQGNLGQLADLNMLQSAQNNDAIGAARRSKTFRTDELTDRTKDRLTELRDKMLQLNQDRRNAYNKNLTEAQFLRQRSLSGAVDIAGALQNQNLAQAMAAGQLQQQALDTTAMADQINMNRQNQDWTNLQNQAAMQQLRDDAGMSGSGFVPWKKLNEGSKRSFMESILGPYMGQDPDTGQPGLATDKTSAREMVMNSLSAAGYNVRGNAKLRRWVETYLTSLPQSDMYKTDEAGIGGSY